MRLPPFSPSPSFKRLHFFFSLTFFPMALDATDQRTCFFFCLPFSPQHVPIFYCSFFLFFIVAPFFNHYYYFYICGDSCFRLWGFLNPFFFLYFSSFGLLKDRGGSPSRLAYSDTHAHTHVHACRCSMLPWAYVHFCSVIDSPCTICTVSAMRICQRHGIPAWKLTLQL